jgi:hypothetical protein
LIRVKAPRTLLDLAKHNEITWYVIFTDSPRDYWWTRWLRPGYRHIYAIKWDGFNWIKLEPFTSYVDVSILPYGPGARIHDVVNPKGNDILRVTRYCERDWIRAPWIFGPMTCVEGIKALLGIRAIHIWTPWQLSNYLRKHYGQQT